MNKNKIYAANVIPFPFIIFTVPCPLFMCLTYNKDIYNKNTRNPTIFWAGGIYKHEAAHTIHDITYNIISPDPLENIFFIFSNLDLKKVLT